MHNSLDVNEYLVKAKAHGPCAETYTGLALAGLTRYELTDLPKQHQCRSSGMVSSLAHGAAALTRALAASSLRVAAHGDAPRLVVRVVNRTGYVSIYQSTYLSCVGLTLFRSIDLSVYIYLFTSTSIYLSISIYLSVYLSGLNSPSIYLSIYLSTVSIYLFIYVSISG